MRPSRGTAGLRWLKFPARYFSPQEEPEALSLLGQRQEGAGAAEAGMPGVPGHRGWGWREEAVLVWALGCGRLCPVEPLSGLPATPRRAVGPGGDRSGRGHSRCPTADRAGQGVVGTGAVSPGMEGPPGLGTGRGGDPRETRALGSQH